MTKIDLMVLGLLAEEPMHGYQIKRVLEDNHADLWSEVSTGHLYYTLKKLKKSGWVNEATSQDGNRPPKHVYTLTKAGKQALANGLEELDVYSQRLYFSLDIVIAFAKALALPPAKLEELIKRRREAVEEETAKLQAAWKQKNADGKLTRAEYIIYQHRMGLLSSEISWLKWAVKSTQGLDYRQLSSTTFENDGPHPLR